MVWVLGVVVLAAVGGFSESFWLGLVAGGLAVLAVKYFSLRERLTQVEVERRHDALALGQLREAHRSFEERLVAAEELLVDHGLSLATRASRDPAMAASSEPVAATVAESVTSPVADPGGVLLHSVLEIEALAAPVPSEFDYAGAEQSEMIAASSPAVESSEGSVLPQTSAARVAPAPPEAPSESDPDIGVASLRESLSPALETPAESPFAWLFGGNTAVRAGALVLLVGIGLLAKYAAEHSLFPIEARLACGALLGLGLATFGFTQREKKREFSLTLQGIGVASTYLLTFSAYRKFNLLPSELTFGLLAILGAVHVALALLQSAESLAIVGVLGGFFAPIFASKGGGSHVALFSYFALLNATIFAIVWAKPFRYLNLVGFFCTFGVATAWGVLQYSPAHFGSSLGFLVLFFLYYALGGVLLSLRTAESKGKSIVYGSLTFGVPLGTFSFLVGLMKGTEYGLALGCIALGAFYLGAGWFLLSRYKEVLRTTVEAFLALGVGFATIAIPNALEDQGVTGVAWAVESFGLVWLGYRQNQLRTRVAGSILYFASMGAVLFSQADHALGSMAPSALPPLALGLSGLAHGALRAKRSAPGAIEGRVGSVCASLAVVWWVSGLDRFATRISEPLYGDAVVLLFVAGSALLLEAVAARLVWKFGRGLALLIGPSVVLWILESPFSSHPARYGGWLAIPLALVATFLLATRANKVPIVSGNWGVRVRGAYSALFTWSVTLFAYREVHYWTLELLSDDGWCRAAEAALLALAGLFVVGRAVPQRAPYGAGEKLDVALSAFPIIALAAVHCGIDSLGQSGAVAGVPFVPLANPLDVSSGLTLLALLALIRVQLGARPEKRVQVSWTVLLGGSFLLLNVALARALSNYADVDYSGFALFHTPLVQSAFAVFWTVTGVLTTVISSRRKRRAPWIAGAALLGLVVLKLFVVDLSTSSALIKIVTFLVVGLLLIGVGYLAPVPPEKESGK